MDEPIDAKLKFLPRNLHRSQAASNAKSKRRVTVEDENAGDEESDRRSVFERLGPGGAQRNEKQKCGFEFQDIGGGQFGKRNVCSPGEGRGKRESDKSPDNLRLKFKGQLGSKDRESKLKSQVVVRKPGGASDDESGEDSDSWSIDKLDYKKELELEQKRQELQLALSALEETEEGMGDTKKSATSASDSSPDRTHKKKKDKASRKKDKKKHKKVAEKDFSVEKAKDVKRKHESDDDSVLPHKKRKKKKQDKKHDLEAPPVVPPSEPVGKHRKMSQTKGGKGDLYNPESPTAVARDTSPDDKRSSTSSPKQKGKGKRKKKKSKDQGDASSGKSKKLLSPLKKVLKVKKGPESLSYFKRSRSPSRDSVQGRKRARMSPSGSSSSRSPPQKKKPYPGTAAKESRGKRSKSLERKKRGRDHRSASSSSSSSSSSSLPSPHQGRKKVKKLSLPSTRSESGSSKRARLLLASSRKEVTAEKKRRGASSESWSRSKDGPSETGRGGKPSAERGRQREKWKKNEPKPRDATSRQNLSQPRSGTRTRKDASDHPRKGSRDRRDGKGEVARAGDRDTSKGDKGGDARKGVLDRDRDVGRGDNEMRKGPGVSAQHLATERGAQFGSRGDGDRDRRGYEDTAGRYLPGSVQRLGQFPMDRQRAGFDRGGKDSFDRQQREGFAQRGDRDRPSLLGPGHSHGRDSSWDERGRREGGGEDGFREDWDGGRDSRGPGFPEFRNEERGREFGGRRDVRRGGGVASGREERLLPFPAGGDGPKGAGHTSEARDGVGRFPQVDVHPSGGGGALRDKGGRDWKAADGGPQDSRDRERESSRTRRGEDDGRSSRGSGRVPEEEFLLRGKPGGERDGRPKPAVIIDGKPSALVSLQIERVKEGSPVNREETSLASLFSQTETVSVKRKPTKSFWGKKSPKRAEDSNKEKGKPGGVMGRLGGAKGRGILDKKVGGAFKSADALKPEPDRNDGKADGKHEEAVREKKSRTPSPKGSLKSGDSSRSRHSQSRSSKRSSRSPDYKRSSARSPASKRSAGESLRSPRKLSRSPAPSSRDKDKDKDRKSDVARSPAPSNHSSGRDRRKKESEKKVDEEKPKSQTTRGRRRGRSRSLSRSGSESRHKGPEEMKRSKSSDSESLPAKLEGGDIAAAMLGDGIDDGLQEEKVFSDWSEDDDADNILMGGVARKHQVEDLDHPRYDLEPRNRWYMGPSRYGDVSYGRLEQEGYYINDALLEKPALEKNIPNVKIVEDTQKEKPARERRRRDTDDEGYEEISSDENELDEEGEKTSRRTIVSILDIDLKALMPSSKPKISAGPVFQRFKPASVFSELGVSCQFAGADLFSQVQSTCQQEVEQMAMALREEENEQETIVKEEPPSTNENDLDQGNLENTEKTIKEELDSDVNTDLTSSDINPNLISSKEVVLKSENMESPDVKSLLAKRVVPLRAAKPMFKLFSTKPACHKLLQAKAQQKSALLGDAGIFRQALTARKDLDIRRQLCKIDANYDQSAVYPSGGVDPDLFRQCLHLFKQKKPNLLPQTTLV